MINKTIIKFILILFILFSISFCTTTSNSNSNDDSQYLFDIVTNQDSLTVSISYDDIRNTINYRPYKEYVEFEEYDNDNDYILNEDEYDWFEDFIALLNEIIKLRDFRNIDYNLENMTSISISFKKGIPQTFFVFKDFKATLSGRVRDNLIKSVIFVEKNNTEYLVVYDDRRTPTGLYQND